MAVEKSRAIRSPAGDLQGFGPATLAEGGNGVGAGAGVVPAEDPHPAPGQSHRRPIGQGQGLVEPALGVGQVVALSGQPRGLDESLGRPFVVASEAGVVGHPSGSASGGRREPGLFRWTRAGRAAPVPATPPHQIVAEGEPRPRLNRMRRRTPSSRWSRISMGGSRSTEASRSTSMSGPRTAAVRRVGAVVPARSTRSADTFRIEVGAFRRVRRRPAPRGTRVGRRCGRGAPRRGPDHHLAGSRQVERPQGNDGLLGEGQRLLGPRATTTRSGSSGLR